MNHGIARRILALAALAAVSACSSASGTSPSLPATTAQQIKPATVNPILANIVAVGDSLTAGYQADGMLGEEVPNPLQQGYQVHATQENGFWALIDEQASELPIADAIAREYNPAESP